MSRPDVTIARGSAVAALVAAGLAATALAATVDPRGWTAGVVAVNSAAVVSGPPERAPLDLPKALAQRITGPTLLVYFSPTCPHCRHVAPELEALSRRLASAGKAKLIGVSSGSATEAELLAFRAEFGITFDVVIDADRDIQAALGVSSTPSAILVRPKPPAGKGKGADKGAFEAVDLWYPYLPGWDALVEGRIAGDPFSVYAPAPGGAPDGRYFGNNACGVCHLQEQASWRLTLHAVAWRTLERAGETGDPACTGCHVTGAGAPGGWAGDPDSRLVDVGCEACHGPGGPHDGQRADARAACVGCHDAKHAIAFTVDKGLPLIDHFKVNALSDEAYDARRRALYDGEVPQELIAFPTGANVGSAKCQACHAVEYAQWSGSPHANGMASLAKEGSADPACVRCHATARTSGPAPTTLAGFDTFGGVGCESCHGPGEAHVAAGGGTDNIQGLGESCPVCVIDAVCTGCHTPKWSPAWDLDEALPKVAHAPGP